MTFFLVISMIYLMVFFKTTFCFYNLEYFSTRVSCLFSILIDLFVNLYFVFWNISARHDNYICKFIFIWFFNSLFLLFAFRLWHSRLKVARSFWQAQRRIWSEASIHAFSRYFPFLSFSLFYLVKIDICVTSFSPLNSVLFSGLTTFPRETEASHFQLCFAFR